MASIHKVLRSACWYCAFYLPDGRRAFRSTGTSDRKKAWDICQQYEKAARQGREGRLTEIRARRAIADIFAIANREKLPSATVRDFLESWLAKKRLEVAESSHAGYATIAKNLVAFLGDKADRPIDSIVLRHLTAFRDHEAERVTAATVNKGIKILRSAWSQARKDGLIQENVFDRLDRMKGTKTRRRAFTLGEIKRLLGACNEEWRGLVMFGFYTGQRLGDLAGLTWQNIDLQENELHFVTGKTGRPMNIPLAKPLADYLMRIPTSDKPNAPLFPSCYGAGTNTLSGRFYKIMFAAGMVREKSHHENLGKGRSAQRATGGPSFHCLRHTATSLLKNAGVSDVVAREIIGHESEAVSRVYTHIETDTLRKAVNKMPDVLSPEG